MTEVVIIGAGLAGLVTAYHAAKNGARVKIVAKGWGATHWSAGTIDALGYYPDEKSPAQNVFDSLDALTHAEPNHPYALIDRRAIADAFAQFAALTREIGLPYEGNATKNLWLPSPVGAARPAFIAPRAQLTGDLSRQQPMLIVGLRGMRDFYPELIAENLSKQGHAARAAFLPLDTITARHDSNTVQLASTLDDTATRAKLGGALKQLVRAGERIGLPAILGMNVHDDVIGDLRDATGADIFEIPTLPPSVPGIRLNTALNQHLQKLGVRVDVNMQVTAFHAENGRIQYVESETSGRPLKHRGDVFVLATGGILGGGVNSDHTGKTWEVVFGLPLAAPAQRTDWFRTRFIDSQGHPVFRTGVRVNRDFQPVDANGARVFENLYAAGGILAHADAIRERSLEGIAIATGTAVGKATADR
ncbi:MAG: glycerol-3-phosphate dehydrogenase subunit GlpB [Chloroflexi bacterium]|nr:glycerol-3-phosphate dehydrogenase subunit GlpB [Chloroflexota bacterium]